MPEIKSFCGLRYNPGKVRDLAAVVAPPYDVISPKEQEALYRKSPYNVIRLELGKEKPGDSARDNKYTRARDFLKHWKSEGTLIRESEPALYIYRQDYRDAKHARRSRVGFLAAMKIDEKAVLKHENTLAAPKKDRTALLKETRTNLSPIWGLFEDKDGRVKRALETALKAKPAVDITLDNVRHRLYVETRAGVTAAITAAMRRKSMFIADGHHRFEVACGFRDWMRSRVPDQKGEAPWDYVLTYFSDCVHNPLEIYPTHRLVRLPRGTNGPLEVLRKKGQLKKISGLEEMMSRGKRLEKNRQETPGKGYDFGIYTKENGFYLFTLDKKVAAHLQKDPVRRLDVSVLHRLILEPCFGIKAIEKSKAIDFTRRREESCAKVRKGEFDMAIFLRPTSLKEMLLVSKKGLKMPQKSTYFYPKLLSGLVFHSLESHD